MGWFLTFTAIVFFALAAWRAKGMYDLGTDIGTALGTRLMAMSFAATAALALWPKWEAEVHPTFAGTLVAGEHESLGYVGLALDDPYYHAVGSPCLQQTLPFATRLEAEEGWKRQPCPTCILRIAGTPGGSR